MVAITYRPQWVNTASGDSLFSLIGLAYIAFVAVGLNELTMLHV